MSNKIYTHDYEVLPKHMKYVIGETRSNLIMLYQKFPNVKFNKLYNGSKSGFHLETSSLNSLENVKQELYKLIISAENICNQIATRKHTLKERHSRQQQYEAAERLRKTFETDIALMKINEPLEQEVIVTDANITKNIKNKLIDANNPFSALDCDD